MGRHDWYRNENWTPAIARDFDVRIARSRLPWSKWQQFTVQAGMLALANDKEVRRAAIELYERSLTEVKGVEPDWRVLSLHGAADVHLALGELDAAENKLRAAIAASPLDVRRMHTGSSPEDDLSRLLRHTRVDCDDQADELLKMALTLRPERAPRLVELQAETPMDLGDEPISDPEQAAESLVVYHHVLDHFADEALDALFRGDRSVWEQLDRRWLVRPERYRIAHWKRTWLAYLPCLAAYVGRSLVREGARWGASCGPWAWAVRIGAEDIPLVPLAFRCLWEDWPLRRVVEPLLTLRAERPTS